MNAEQSMAMDGQMYNVKKRNDVIDFVKGALVLLMVIYHVMNYFQYGYVPHRYMGFLPCSFIMITGFLVMQVYSAKFKKDSTSVSIRLAIRAFKLVVIFIFLNLAARTLWAHNREEIGLNIYLFFNHWFNIFILGNIEKVSFDVLLPIGYTLIFAIFILKIQAASSKLNIFFALFFIALCVLMDLNNHVIYNVLLLSAGVAGLALGVIQMPVVEKYACSLILMPLIGFVYFGFIFFEIDNYISQISTTFMSLIVLYSIGLKLNSKSWGFIQICQLGKYSLVSYIAQILFLQLTKNLISLSNNQYYIETVFFMFATLLFTWISVSVTHYGRRKFRLFSGVYDAVFG